MSERQPAIGFIGIGSMGLPMASRLAEKGYKLTLFDSDKQRLAKVTGELAAVAAPSPQALGGNVEVVITILPTSNIVEQVLVGKDGLLSSLKPGGLLIEMSSGSPERSRHFANMLADVGSTFIDAPVSGGVQRAKSGELAIMVGGAEADIHRARPILECMGTTILPTGSVGSAHAMKALNNLCSAAGLLVAVEALLIGKKAGLSPNLMVDVLNVSTGMNNATQKKLKQFILSRQFNSGFGLDLMVKDLSIALDVAHRAGVAAPFSGLCREIWSAAAGLLGTGRDHTEIARLSEQLSNSELS